MYVNEYIIVQQPNTEWVNPFLSLFHVWIDTHYVTLKP